MCNKEEDIEMAMNVAYTEKELKEMQKNARKRKILALANKACDRNDEALKKLSKN
ncbi:hypothetical protein J7E79_26555 [Bacillus sp. ISL-40]|uniref:hypothetical protein n=1 Tax=unclassified Bacillus (in: firmicutes) TaxID=185979 RepID=UPI001BE52607|nr:MULTISPECIES: hypothetical protein [unclassified Bacillus (in: firmicutes)]MBT2700883.1 hypothetical protein [Bacillus sp. ISL-40]MBT2724840.1 hypothetical protein [Bacillus sp. ISL-46]MBT2740701.1 hypothetical protein [Bacillus sp. ISL-77]